MNGYRVGVLGATGAVGSTVLRVLEERSFPVSELVPLASERSAGKRLDFAGDSVECLALSQDSIEGLDLVISSAGGAVSSEWAPRLIAAGAVVVDNTSYWRMHDDVPLVVPEVNPEDAEGHRGLIANPNCSTMQMVVALKPIQDAAGIERLVITTQQSVSGTGKRAVDELLDSTHRALHEMAPEAPVAYPHAIAFNVLPQAGSFEEGDAYTDEEHKLENETRKILMQPDIGISATCTRVPVRVGHSESVNVQTRDPLEPDRCRELLAAAPGVVVLDEPARAIYPLATEAEGRDDVLVGRVRRDPSHPRCLNLFIVSDNLRKGAATNAVQLAELLHERGLLRRAARA